MIKFLRYFFYIAWNWNVFIAVYIIFLEIKGERKYGINTIGIDELEKMDTELTDHSTIYMPAIYSVLELVFEKIDVKNIHHLLDIGSGKGRVLCVAAAKGCKKVTGIDFSKELCLDALQNLTRIQQNYPAIKGKVINNDAIGYEIPIDVDCIFLFNPFDGYLMGKVVCNIKKSLAKQPRQLTIIYANPLYKSMFEEAGFKETFHSKKMRYIEVSIFTAY